MTKANTKRNAILTDPCSLNAGNGANADNAPEEYSNNDTIRLLSVHIYRFSRQKVSVNTSRTGLSKNTKLLSGSNFHCLRQVHSLIGSKAFIQYRTGIGKPELSKG